VRGVPSVDLGRGLVVFFDELQVDIGGGAIGAIEFAAIDAEELQSFGKAEGWGVTMS